MKKSLLNYGLVFFYTYIMLFTTKLVFIYYLQEHFTEYSVGTLIYALLWGCKYDFVLSSVVALLSSFTDFNKKIYSVLIPILIISLFFTQIADILYFNEASRHVSYEVKDSFTDAYSLFMTAYTQHTLFTILSLSLGVILFVFTLYFFSKISLPKINLFYFTSKLILIIVTIFFIRGMFQPTPLTPWHVNQIGDPKLASVALTASYNILHAIINEHHNLQKRELPFISEEAIKKSFSTLYPQTKQLFDLPIITTKPNIVLLFLEGWSAKHLQPYGFKHDTTPYFNSYLGMSLRPKFMVAGGHRTTEGIFATLVSFQNPLGKSVAESQLQNYQYSSLVTIFKKINYNSAFFQGTLKETSGTGSLAQSLGFLRSYGRIDISDRQYKENTWGVQDPDLYNFVLNKLSSTIQEPFIIGINGATTHDDKIPDTVKTIPFVEDQTMNRRLNALHFSDFAMGEFISKMEDKYPNTIFVIFADHCGSGLSDSLENYMIPFAIYSKKLITPLYKDVILSQRDIAPTVHDLVIGNYKSGDNAFTGKSLIRDEKFSTDYYHNGLLGWIEHDNLVEFNTATETIACFKIENFKKRKTSCNHNYTQLRKHALSFTTISQELLFSNKTGDITKYIYNPKQIEKK